MVSPGLIVRHLERSALSSPFDESVHPAGSSFLDGVAGGAAIVTTAAPEVPGTVAARRLVHVVTHHGIDDDPIRDFFGIREANPDEVERSADFYLKGRLVDERMRARVPFEDLSALPPFVEPPLPPLPQETFVAWLCRIIRRMPRPPVIEDPITTIRRRLEPMARKIFDQLGSFNAITSLDDREFLALRLRDVLRRPHSSPLLIMKRVPNLPFSRTITYLPNGTVTVKLGLLARGGNKKIYNILYVLPNGDIKPAIEQRLLKESDGSIKPPRFTLAQEACLADLFDSPYIIKGPRAFFRRPNGNESVILDKMDGDFREILRGNIPGYASITLKESFTILYHQALALIEVHRKRFVHRDFKSNNILVSRNPDGTICGKLSDFGILVAQERAAQKRRDLLTPIELSFQESGLFVTADGTSSLAFPLLQEYLDDNGGIYPLPDKFKTYVIERMLDPINIPFMQSGDEDRPYESGSVAILCPHGDPVFPLYKKYRKSFPVDATALNRTAFISFLRDNIKSIVANHFVANRDIFKEDKRMVFKPLQDMFDDSTFTKFPSRGELDTLLHIKEINPDGDERRQYDALIPMLEQIDRCASALAALSDDDLRNGTLSPLLKAYIDPVGFRAVMRLLNDSQTVLKEFKKWETIDPADVVSPSYTGRGAGAGARIASTPEITPLTTQYHLQLYPAARSFLTVLYHELKKIKIAGTRGYLPPESLEGKIISSKADIYALGIVLAEVLRVSRFRSYFDARPHFREYCELLIDQWTRRDYTKRPTAEECAEALQHIVEYILTD